jgi:hypothetical protein
LKIESCLGISLLKRAEEIGSFKEGTESGRSILQAFLKKT